MTVLESFDIFNESQCLFLRLYWRALEAPF
jgi:hypothetical protein